MLFCIAFLNQARSGAVHDAIDRLMEKSVFSYGISDKAGGLRVKKPDGSIGLVDFSYLASKSPEPFKAEWSGGKGIHEHHKFVVTDFSLPTAKVFTGSSNLSVNGEEKNGDNLVMIEDPKVRDVLCNRGPAYLRSPALPARMKSASDDDRLDSLTLQKPAAMTGAAAWFEKFYVRDSQAEHDRMLFSH